MIRSTSHSFRGTRSEEGDRGEGHKQIWGQRDRPGGGGSPPWGDVSYPPKEVEKEDCFAAPMSHTCSSALDYFIIELLIIYR